MTILRLTGALNSYLNFYNYFENGGGTPANQTQPIKAIQIYPYPFEGVCKRRREGPRSADNAERPHPTYCKKWQAKSLTFVINTWIVCTVSAAFWSLLFI